MSARKLPPELTVTGKGSEEDRPESEMTQNPFYKDPFFFLEYWHPEDLSDIGSNGRRARRHFISDGSWHSKLTEA